MGLLLELLCYGMVTHDPYVASYSNKFVYLKDGRIEKQLIKNDSQKKYYKEIKVIKKVLLL